MKVKIETYREFDIYFETSAERFESLLGVTDRKSTSYSMLKKTIDDYIKENITFPSFSVMLHPNSYWGRKGKIITVIGIRKDRSFVGINEKGEKVVLSISDEPNYLENNDHNLAIINEWLKIKEIISQKQEELHNLELKLQIFDFRKLRKDLNIPE